MLDVPVLRPSVTETTGLGAAYLAGVGAGLWKPAELAERWKLERRFSPAMAPAARAAAYARLAARGRALPRLGRALSDEPPTPTDGTRRRNE